MIVDNIGRKQHAVTTLQASAAKTETGTGSSVRLPDAPNGYAFVLDLTAAATDANDTLDVQVQTKLDGTNWTAICSFTQCAGNAGAKRHVGKVVANGSQTMFENSATLSAGSVRNVLGDEYRVIWTIADPTGTNVSFTFSVTAIPM